MQQHPRLPPQPQARRLPGAHACCPVTAQHEHQQDVQQGKQHHHQLPELLHQLRPKLPRVLHQQLPHPRSHACQLAAAAAAAGAGIDVTAVAAIAIVADAVWAAGSGCCASPRWRRHLVLLCCCCPCQQPPGDQQHGCTQQQERSEHKQQIHPTQRQPHPLRQTTVLTTLSCCRRQHQAVLHTGLLLPTVSCSCYSSLNCQQMCVVLLSVQGEGV